MQTPYLCTISLCDIVSGMKNDKCMSSSCTSCKFFTAVDEKFPDNDVVSTLLIEVGLTCSL